MTHLQKYLSIKDTLKNTPAKLTGGIMYRYYQGRWIKEIDFKRAVKLPESPYGAKCNPDGTRIINT